MFYLDLIKKILDIILLISKYFTEKIWLTFLTICVIISLALHLEALNNLNFFKKKSMQTMGERVQNYSSKKNKIEKIMSKFIDEFKDIKGEMALEFIPTQNKGTEAEPDYVGIVSNLMQYNPELKKSVDATQKVLKFSGIAIPYALPTSKVIQMYALSKDAYISLSNKEIIAIDEILMNKMFNDESELNGKKYWGNIDFPTSRDAWAFILDEEKRLVAQVVLLMDEEFEKNTKESHRKALMIEVANEIAKLFK